MKIYNARITSENGQLIPGSIRIENEWITDVIYSDRSSSGDLDAHGWIVSPGWIDLQINGGFGFDFTEDPGKIWEVGAQLPRYGVTGFLPTVITAPPETYQKALRVWEKGAPEGWQGAIPLGWHFEGPFLNPEKKGAHNPAMLLQPKESLSQEWNPKSGVALVTMAPELPGALSLARSLAARGVVLSAGHSMATLEMAQQAQGAGYTAATHLFNAMPPLDHRAPGLAAEVLLNPRFTAGIIADGIHVHPEMVHLAWQMKGPRSIALVTDAVGSLGLPPGSFVQGGMEIIVDESAARLKNGTLAGSILTLDKALRNLMKFTGADVEQVLPALSSNQARLLHLERSGRIGAGCLADLTVIDDSGHVRLTVIRGEVVYSAGE